MGSRHSPQASILSRFSIQDEASDVDSLRRQATVKFQSAVLNKDMASIDRAIAVLTSLLASDLKSFEEPDPKPRAMGEMGELLLLRYYRSNDLKDARDSFEWLLRAKDLTLDTCEQPPTKLYMRAIILNLISTNIVARFERKDSTARLEDAIAASEEVIRFTPPDDSHVSAYLAQLSSVYYFRSVWTQSKLDLDRAIEKGELAIRLTKVDGRGRSARLTKISPCYYLRFTLTGDKADIDRCVSMYEESLRCGQASHPERCSVHYNLSMALIERFKAFQDFEDFKRAKQESKQALEMATPGDSTWTRIEEQHQKVIALENQYPHIKSSANTRSPGFRLLQAFAQLNTGKTESPNKVGSEDPSASLEKEKLERMFLENVEQFRRTALQPADSDKV